MREKIVAVYELKSEVDTACKLCVGWTKEGKLYMQPEGDRLFAAMVSGELVVVGDHTGSTPLAAIEWLKQTYPQDLEDFEKLERMIGELRLGKRKVRAQSSKKN